MKGNIISTKNLMIIAVMATALVACITVLGGQAIASHSDTDLYVNDDATIGDGSSCDFPDFNSIQAAINHAIPGDTVLVCPGTYPEQLLIDKPSTVKSTDGPAVTTVGANLYLVWITASNVTLEGFTITNPNAMSTADNSAIICSGAGNVSNIRILNNIIEAPASPDRPSSDFGTFGINCITGGSLSDVEVAGNIFRNIHDPDLDGVAIAIFFYSDAPGSSGINIHDNVIHDITAAAGPDRARAITISSGVLGASITCNTLYDNGVGIRVTSTATGVEVHYNNIYDNTFRGLWNNTSGAVNAENNWWGAADGPSGEGLGSGDAVGNTGSGSVDFDPWLTSLQEEPCPTPPIEEICSTLGDDRFRFLPDVDIFTFEGMEGETVNITLDSDPDGESQGSKASLILFNKIGHGFIFKTDIGSLPNEITVKLRKDGVYWITVQEQFRHGGFRGDYCLTIVSDAVDQPELFPTASVESDM